ncbi:MAG: hypothetical protein R8G34_03750 [Paracoccaceae bacterium]|nr:hypothetical protein [Paracoccaceae bacterium]
MGASIVTSKAYKHGTRGATQFVQLTECLQRTEAWATLKLCPRALYVELKRRYNGHHNGQIFLSQRDAAKALNVHRNAIGPSFGALDEPGSTLMTKGPFHSLSGVGIAAQWALTEIAFICARKARQCCHHRAGHPARS